MENISSTPSISSSGNYNTLFVSEQDKETILKTLTVLRIIQSTTTHPEYFPLTEGRIIYDEHFKRICLSAKEIVERYPLYDSTCTVNTSEVEVIMAYALGIITTVIKKPFNEPFYCTSLVS